MPPALQEEIHSEKTGRFFLTPGLLFATIKIPAWIDGGVSEWFKEAVLKTVVPKGTVGSNPTPSAMVYERSRPEIDMP